MENVPLDSALESWVTRKTGFLKLMSLGGGGDLIFRSFNFQIILFLKKICISTNMEIIDSENLSITGQNNRKLNVEQGLSFFLLHMAVNIFISLLASDSSYQECF